ncbi:MAG: hypothetical protein II008_11460 [Oscillospiraceae bacterium]|nr:hypothetical protein [Oscillospiraceae bacterium]
MSKYWYAAVKDASDWDLGYGSFDLDEALRMARNLESPDAFVLVVDGMEIIDKIEI